MCYRRIHQVESIVRSEVNEKKIMATGTCCTEHRNRLQPRHLLRETRHYYARTPVGMYEGKGSSAATEIYRAEHRIDESTAIHIKKNSITLHVPPAACYNLSLPRISACLTQCFGTDPEFSSGRIQTRIEKPMRIVESLRSAI